MPRPKVKDSERQRSARACLPCKASKIRCDAASPCGPCAKRDRVSACVYLESTRKRRKLSHANEQPLQDQSQQQHQQPLESPYPLSSLDGNSPTNHHSTPVQSIQRKYNVARFDPVDTAPAPSAPATTTATSTPTPEPGQTSSKLTQSRILLSSKGEKLYVGENASLSFLQFVRQIVKKYMGPSPFTENQFKDSMLEVEMARDDSPTLCDQSRSDKHALVQLYREASSGILDLFTVEETHGFLDRHNALSPSIFIETEDKHTRAEQAALNMMLAIGSQCRGQTPFDSYNAARSFTCAQKFAFEGFLCDPSLDMVRVFLLMAFYMLGACHRNAAFMYLGIASKAACALGLHRTQRYAGLSSQECLIRWRTWKSLLVLDTIVSSILGRPGGLPSVRLEDDTKPIGEDDKTIGELDRPRWLATRAVFTISSHILELEQQLGNGNGVDASTAESFLQRLREWNDSLPAELRHFASMKETTLGPAEKELFVGATHVACTYYFTIILVTRPFLIAHLVSQLRRSRPQNRRPSTSRSEPAHVSDLAQACLDSAMYMAKTGYMAVSSSILSNNMCILKAWMFAAGLLLGFSMFTQTEPVPDIDGAFQNAISVLERLAQISPQARLYSEILNSFSDTIRTRREQMDQERRRKSDRYVSQIFTADFHNGTPMPPPAQATTAPAIVDPPNLDPALSSSLGAAADANSLDAMLNLDFDPGSYESLSAFPEDWNDMPLLTDNLYMDWDTLLPSMDS